MTVKELRDILYKFNDDSEIKCCGTFENVEDATGIHGVTVLQYFAPTGDNETVIIRTE